MIPLFVPSLELAEREELGSFYTRLPDGVPTFLGAPITVAFHIGENTFFVGHQMVMLTRPIPIRHLRWLRVLLPRLAEVLPTIIATLQREEPEFADPARMQAELAQPTISFSANHTYGEWDFHIEQPSYGGGYGFSITFSQFTVTDSLVGD
jgi:hypothetical protein